MRLVASNSANIDRAPAGGCGSESGDDHFFGGPLLVPAVTFSRSIVALALPLTVFAFPLLSARLCEATVHISPHNLCLF